MQKELGRFAHRAHKEEKGEQLSRVHLHPDEVDCGLGQRGGRVEHVVKGDAVDHEEEAEDAEGEAKVTNTVDDEGFH